MLYKMLTNCKISCKQQTSTQIEEICNYETFTFRRRAYSHLRKTERRNGLSGPHRTSNSFLLEMSMTIPCVSICSKYKEKRELNCRANIAWSIPLTLSGFFNECTVHVYTCNTCVWWAIGFANWVSDTWKIYV